MDRIIACITQEHNPWLLLVSLVLCAITSTAAYLMVSRASAREEPYLKTSWSVLAGATAGLGVWATHFVAMTAYDVGMPMRFLVAPLIISAVIAVAACTFMFWLAHRTDDMRLRAVAGAGAGLCIILTQFIAVAGVVVAADVVWDVPMVWLTWLIGMGLAGAATVVYYREQTLVSALKAGALFMAAIFGAHFVAVSAITFIPNGADIGAANGTISHQLIGFVVGSGSFVVLAIGLVGVLLDTYLSDRSGKENVRLRDNVREATAELAALLKEQSELRDRAEAANVAKSQFLANMSHELRTPLNAIIGYGEIIQEDIEDLNMPSVTADSKRIVAAAKHLLTIINDVLDLSKIEAGRVELEIQDFDTAALLSESLSAVRPAAKNNNVTLALDLADNLGAGRSDGFKIKQCLINLLSNAVKFTKDGTVTLRAKRETAMGREWFVFDVADTGIGMSEEQIDRLFQAFVQADATITRTHGGTGLGLSITQRMSHVLGGDVTVASKPGQGSTFTLRLPAAFIEPIASDHDETEAFENAAQKPVVIVIEDDASARDLVRRALDRVGFAVVTAATAIEGQKLIDKHEPALVILDLHLPDRPGTEVLAALQQRPLDQQVPVIVFSSESARQKTMALGACAHIEKPVDRDTLAAAALRFARRRPAQATDAVVEDDIAPIKVA